jgi:hypothetical protein
MWVGDFRGQDLSNKKTRTPYNAQFLRNFVDKVPSYYFKKRDMLLALTVHLA